MNQYAIITGVRLDSEEGIIKTHLLTEKGETYILSDSRYEDLPRGEIIGFLPGVKIVLPLAKGERVFYRAKIRILAALKEKFKTTSKLLDDLMKVTMKSEVYMGYRGKGKDKFCMDLYNNYTRELYDLTETIKTTTEWNIDPEDEFKLAM